MSSLPHPPMHGAYGPGYSGSNGPMPMPVGGANGLVTTFAAPAGSMMHGLEARASARFANTRNLSRSRERLLDEGDDLEGGPNMTRINDSVIGGGMVGQGGTTTTDWVAASGVSHGEARRMAQQPHGTYDSRGGASNKKRRKNSKGNASTSTTTTSTVEVPPRPSTDGRSHHGVPSAAAEKRLLSKKLG